MRHAILALLLLAGCSILPRPPAAKQPAAPAPPPRADELGEIKAGLRASARQLEAKGDGRGALEKRRILAAISHDNSSLAASVRAGEETLRKVAEDMYRRGLEQHLRGDVKAARKHYLSALRIDPDHAGALDELKNGLGGGSFVYATQEAAPLADIAGRVYGNGKLAVILAAVNGLEVSRPLPAGARLTVPQLDDALLAAPGVPGGAKPVRISRPAAAADRPGAYTGQDPPATSRLASARKLLNERRFREAAEEALKVPGDSPLAPEAREIINGAYFHIGGLLADEGRLPMALDAYRRVDRNYRNAGETIDKLKKRMTELAEEHYIAGVKFFVSQRLEEAITEWQKTLGLKPDHEKAGEDIRKAAKLLEELQKVQEPSSPAPK